MFTLDDIGDAIDSALKAPDLVQAAVALERRHALAECDRLVATVTAVNGLQTPLKECRDRLTLDGIPPEAFERLVLLRHAAEVLPRIPALPVSDDVKRLFAEEFRYIAAPPPKARFDVAKGGFVALAELVTLRRFPAGQYHFQLSGLPRSWVLKVKGRDRFTLLYWVARKMKGFGPVFFPHLNPHRRNRWLTEQEADRSYYRMATSMRLQPEVKGLVASSWLRSPDTYKASPHLAWMNRTMENNGGLVLIMGMADPESGVLARSAERKSLYEAGEFIPTTGLVLWPRDAMLAWAAAHPELSSPGPGGRVAAA